MNQKNVCSLGGSVFPCCCGADSSKNKKPPEAKKKETLQISVSATDRKTSDFIQSAQNTARATPSLSPSINPSPPTTARQLITLRDYVKAPTLSLSLSQGVSVPQYTPTTLKLSPSSDTDIVSPPTRSYTISSQKDLKEVTPKQEIETKVNADMAMPAKVVPQIASYALLLDVMEEINSLVSRTNKILYEVIKNNLDSPCQFYYTKIELFLENSIEFCKNLVDIIQLESKSYDEKIAIFNPCKLKILDFKKKLERLADLIAGSKNQEEEEWGMYSRKFYVCISQQLLPNLIEINVKTVESIQHLAKIRESILDEYDNRH